VDTGPLVVVGATCILVLVGGVSRWTGHTAWLASIQSGLERLLAVLYKAYEYYIRTVLFFLAGGGVYFALTRTADGWALVPQLLVLIPSTFLLLGLVLTLAHEPSRTSFFSALKANGRLQPLMFMVGVFYVAMGVFSSLTLAIYDRSAFELASGSSFEAARVADFYGWHFLDAIPGVNLTDTLQLKRPMTYDAAGVGWLLLAFKVAVIIPLIAGLRVWWQSWFERGANNTEVASDTEGTVGRPLELGL
jgi:hypothetical protein